MGYPAAIDAGALTVMASFSSWQGVKHHGNKGLLTDALKTKMGFEGFVVGAWNGHGQVAGCSVTDCAHSINAGLDSSEEHTSELQSLMRISYAVFFLNTKT